MEIVSTFEAIEKPYKNAVITIGNFDGVHIGHQALFRTVIDKAEAIHGTAVAMTFDPHPLRVLSPNSHPPMITMPEQKAELIAKTGMEVLIRIPFTREFAAISARDFVERLLMERIGMRAMVVGNDYAFGRNREGNLALLQQWSEELGFDVLVVDWVHTANGMKDRISSTQIREQVMAGDMTAAKRMLGRHYQIRGVVATGRNRGGRLLGFPTANILIQDELCPKEGIYAVTVEHDGQTFPGVANIGYSPTFDDHLFTIEVHLLDFDRNIYNDPIRVNFIQRLRDEIKFDSLDELTARIRQDVVQARQILSGMQ
ncbi:bifunctional riboflavin kinase/FAD synthetase [Desulfatitalea alkaliphila]|uniref:Riboflavin biosynthesis protein n=1 Tax=Desulfatitalea alkaliphila TaxID=2929485 RepID=A0AA41R479_9BACT|nr:bifunctional riboflavin kinase/FAD synthetase [Desulfatitalea alkaliphila]MCJ8500570.1 bifunctional riboflavin kinase/FAD synthetase [Desulfatitalea alkaliphila]